MRTLNSEFLDIFNTIYGAFQHDGQLNIEASKHPFLIGVTGASASGKTTFSHLLKTGLTEKNPSLRVTVISTDTFIYPNKILIQKHLMNRKGFPESFDMKKLQLLLSNFHQKPETDYEIPYYCHDLKDIDPQKKTLIPHSHIYIVEGINLFFHYSQEKNFNFSPATELDFCIYLNIDLEISKKRALKRFFDAYEKSKQSPNDYFNALLDYSETALYDYAESLWLSIDLAIANQYITPYKNLANLIIDELPEIDFI